MSNFFATNLKFLRQNKNMSITELSKRLNVHQSTISRWENKEMGATVDNALDISNVFNVSLPELLGKDLRLQENFKPQNTKNTTKFETENGIKVTVGHNNPLSATDLLEIQSKLAKYIDKNKND